MKVKVYLDEHLVLSATMDWLADIFTWIRMSPYNYKVKVTK